MNPVIALKLISLLFVNPASPQEPTTLREISASRVKLAERNFDDASRSIDQAAERDELRPVAVSVHALIDWSSRWMDAERDLAEDESGRLMAVRKHAERLQKHVGKLEKVAAARRLPSFALNYAIFSAKILLDTDPAPLSVTRIEIARRAFSATDQDVVRALADEKLRGGALNLEDFVGWSNRWMIAERDAAKTIEAKKSAVDDHIERIQTRKNALEALGIQEGSDVSQLHVDLLNYAIFDAQASLGTDVKRLSVARMKIVRRAYDNARRMIDQTLAEQGPERKVVDARELVSWSTRWMDSERGLSETPEGDVAAINRQIERLRPYRDMFNNRVRAEAARVQQDQIDLLSDSILDAQSRLIKLRTL